MIRGKARILRDGKVAARHTSIHSKINGSRKVIIDPGKMRGPPVARTCIVELETTDIRVFPRGQDRLQPQELWCAFESPPITKRLPREPKRRRNSSTGYDQEDSRQRKTKFFQTT